jgi:hypothetical protein
MKIFPEVLGTKQRQALRRLGPILSERGFYLAGGTALAMQLGHRRSVDFHWLTSSGISDPLRLAGDLKNAGIPITVEEVDGGTIQGVIEGGRLSLLEYRYPLLKRLSRVPAYTCRLASPADIAAMKLAAVSNRGAKKDFIDIYALIESGHPLAELLAFYSKKYSVTDWGHVLYSLAYFEDADQEGMPSMLWKVDWRTIKRRIQETVRQTASV